MNYKHIATAGATAALLLQSVIPSFAVIDLSILKNGAGSENLLKLMQANTTVVMQTNETQVTNEVKIDANTGDNEVEDSTGGDITVSTGDADIKVEVANELNGNTLVMNACNDCQTDLKAEIANNGADSDNTIKTEDTDATVLIQANEAEIDNKVEAEVETGDNEVEDNTGADIAVVTGDVKVGVDLTNTANANVAQVVPGDEEASLIDLLIKKNGVDTDNKIALDLDTALVLTQDNQTGIGNEAETEASTGDNNVEDNTGGDVGIGTGDIDVKVEMSNTAGFNQADLDSCGCAETEVTATITDNGADADTQVKAELESALVVEQVNTCGSSKPSLFDFLFFFGKKKTNQCFDNQVKMDLVTGDNQIEGSTGNSESDPVIITGNTKIKTGITNLGGSNIWSRLMGL